MKRLHVSHVGPLHALFALTIGLATACSTAEQSGESPALPDGGATAGEAAAPAAAAYTATDEGTGTLWVDGVQFDGFRGQCMISRRNGAEELGELSNREGLSMIMGIDNVAANTGSEMNFKVYSDSVFTISRPPAREQPGTLTRVAREGQPSPKGKSTMLGLVSFTGTTATGEAIIAHVVCELQNKYT